MGAIHLVQSAEERLGPFRAGGDEQRAGHQNDHHRPDHFSGVGARVIFSAVFDGRKNQPDDKSKNNKCNNDKVAGCAFHL